MLPEGMRNASRRNDRSTIHTTTAMAIDLVQLMISPRSVRGAGGGGGGGGVGADDAGERGAGPLTGAHPVGDKEVCSGPGPPVGGCPPKGALAGGGEHRKRIELRASGHLLQS